MPTVTQQWQSGAAGIEVFRRDDLIPMCQLKEGEIPFFQQVMLISDTASREFAIEIDPRKAQPPGPGATPNLPTTWSSGRDFHQDQIWATVAADLSPLIIPIGQRCRRDLMIYSPLDTLWTNTWYYIPIPGDWLPDTELIERLADRRRMDKFDTDEQGESFFRMGQLRRMGDAEPGT